MKIFSHSKVLVIALVGIIAIASATSADAVTPDSKINGLRSAFLGSEVWEDDLPSTEVRHQLQEHFSQVIGRLESSSASSLLLALSRAEATARQPWTKAQRRSALIFLAGNRRRQIARLRYYMNRGLFPKNEGQSNAAVPIFVDQHQTHCAVGYLMHSDGKDSDIASIVNTNNLIHVRDVQGGGMIQWLRSSGLTQEEAMLIQPAYPINLDATFEGLSSPMASVQEGGVVFSQATFRGSRFNAALPESLQNDPSAIRAILMQGQAAIQANDLVTTGLRQTNGVLFGSSGDVAGEFGLDFPANVDNSLYVGSDFGGAVVSFDEVFGLSLSPETGSIFNAGIVEIEYLLRSEQNDFSQIGLTAGGSSPGISDASSLLLLSQIYDGDTDVLLGESQLFATAGAGLSGTDAVQLSTDFVRIKTFGLLVNDESVEPFSGGSLSSFFHEFETSAVPEPSAGSLLILIGSAALARRRRTVSNL